MQELKKIGIMSAAKMFALFGVLLGLIGGISLAISSGSPEALVAVDPTLALVAATLGWWLIIIAPIGYGLIYFVSGVIFAALYNLFSSWVGGVKFDLSDLKKSKK
jgi:hypothetical protein